MAIKRIVDPDTGLDERQLIAFERYMAGESLTEIAKDIGVRRQTIGEWKKSKAWRETDRKRTEENIEATWKSLMKITRKAIETVEKTIEGKANKTQFLAAESVLDRTIGRAKTSIEITNESENEYDLHKRAEELAALKAEQAEENAEESADS